jgi:hypothetical protein
VRLSTRCFRSNGDHRSRVHSQSAADATRYLGAVVMANWSCCPSLRRCLIVTWCPGISYVSSSTIPCTRHSPLGNRRTANTLRVAGSRRTISPTLTFLRLEPHVGHFSINILCKTSERRGMRVLTHRQPVDNVNNVDKLRKPRPQTENRRGRGRKKTDLVVSSFGKRCRDGVTRGGSRP